MLTAGFLGLRRHVANVQADQGYANETAGYGELVKDPMHILDLPKGFHYRVLSRSGDFMDDGLRIPGLPDGMAAFRGPAGRTVLVRNHEITRLNVFAGPYGLGHHLLNRIDSSRLYDQGDGTLPHLGGTTTLVYDPFSGRVERQYLSLGGTCRNCAGGLTPWNTWVTCEETMEKAEKGNQKDHGYNFEVPVSAEPRLYPAIPLKAMGRFRHEAIAVDPKSGIVYQTEDIADGLIYRFIPKEPGNLSAGGILQALAIKGRPKCDTRNWPVEAKKQTKETSDDNSSDKEVDNAKSSVAENTPKDAQTGREDSATPSIDSETPPAPDPLERHRMLEVEWITLDGVESPEDDLRKRGNEAGAAVYSRGEGMWYGNGLVYWACTDGGPAKKGQVFRYRPSPYEGTPLEREYPGTVELYIESGSETILEYCDNLTVAPWGDLILSEDGPKQQYLRVVTQEGKLFTLGRNRINNSEFAGVCFAPNHPTLFVNIQSPGITLAITGPWMDRVA